MPKFSIVVPIYNVGKYIRQCMESIQNQTFKDFEVLCIDDCGTDNSIKIVQEFAQKDSRFKIFHHEHNRGVSAARNTALDNATGKYMVSIDPDDWVEINFLEECNNGFNSFPEADAIWFNSKHYNNMTGELTLTNPIDIKNHMFQRNNKNIDQLVGVIWDKAFKLENIRKINYKFPEGLIVEDDDFTFSYFVNFKNVYRINNALYVYRVERDGSYTTIDKSGKRIKDQLKIYYNIYKYAKQHGFFDIYREFYLQTIANTVNCILLYKDNKLNIMKDANTLLGLINFPEDFEDLDKKQE